jgi:hypothetical protein
MRKISKTAAIGHAAMPLARRRDVVSVAISCDLAKLLGSRVIVQGCHIL